jgi:hypothetical protein
MKFSTDCFHEFYTFHGVRSNYFPESINKLVSVMRTQCAFCEEETSF